MLNRRGCNLRAGFFLWGLHGELGPPSIPAVVQKLNVTLLLPLASVLGWFSALSGMQREDLGGLVKDLGCYLCSGMRLVCED